LGIPGAAVDHPHPGQVEEEIAALVKQAVA